MKNAEVFGFLEILNALVKESQEHEYKIMDLNIVVDENTEVVNKKVEKLRKAIHDAMDPELKKFHERIQGGEKVDSFSKEDTALYEKLTEENNVKVDEFLSKEAKGFEKSLYKITKEELRAMKDITSKTYFLLKNFTK